MANRSILGGSPLGLIGVKSWYGSDGLSTFNAGKTRNIKVQEYNLNKSNAGMISGNSLFSGYRVVRAWPNIIEKPDGTFDTKGVGDVVYSDEVKEDGDPSGYALKKKGDYSQRKVLHNNSVYDTSVLNIIEKLAGTKAALRPADFAYLKNIGVYPNNRLMIARRFAGPSDDNIMVKKKDSDLGNFATLISWVPEGTDFLDFTFGEEWTDAEADFKTILTSLGEDIGLGNLGGIAGAAGNALPLPGFTEIFQRNFLAKMGLIENSAKDSIPAGNPNLIKQAKRRKLIGYSDAGSGLKCEINIKMTCEYELKYISGIDPTIVWMDLLGMILRFGTSNSETYGLSRSLSAKITTWVNNPHQLVKDVAKAISDAISGIVAEIKKVIKDVYDKAIAAANELPAEAPGPDPDPAPAPISPRDEATKKAGEEQNAALKFADAIASTLGKIAMKTLEGLLQKYRVKIIGVVNALSGLPSTPWHITIGNPMRPTFCSGDMLVTSVNLKLGPNLAFNDLPSSITVEFNLVNARPWGLQEIMAKFNSGYLRSVDVQKTFYETQQVKGADTNKYIEPVGILPFNDIQYGTPSSTASTPGGTGSNTATGAGNNTPTQGTGGTVSNNQSVPAGSSDGKSKAEGGGLPNKGDVGKDGGTGTGAVITGTQSGG